MKPDPRKEQLEQLAADGDEAAVGDLFREYGVDYGAGAKEASHDR
jgi:hypothetical protein